MLVNVVPQTLAPDINITFYTTSTYVCTDIDKTVKKIFANLELGLVHLSLNIQRGFESPPGRKV
jgi:hypothetical protein